MTPRKVLTSPYTKNFTFDLRHQLGLHVCAIIECWPQNWATVHINLSQPTISRLRAGQCYRFTADRLLRAIARGGYHVTISLLEMQQRVKERPTVTVLRYDRYGRLVETK